MMMMPMIAASAMMMVTIVSIKIVAVTVTFASFYDFFSVMRVGFNDGVDLQVLTCEVFS